MTESVLVNQAAELIGVSRRTIYYWIRYGHLQTIRTRCGSQRVRMESIDAMRRSGNGVKRLRVLDAGASGTALSERCPAP